MTDVADRATTPLDDFWESSSITAPDAATFGSRVAAYQPPAEGVHPFVGAGRPLPLRPVTDRVQRWFDARRSERSFGEQPLSHRAIEQALAAVGPRRDRAGRVVPEAGGLDAVFAFLVARHVNGPCHGRVVRYDHRDHAVADVTAVPDDDELRRLFLFELDADLPQAVVIFVVDDRAVRSKYGERAGRFALQQVGHAAQNIGLRAGADGLHAYVLGGGLDLEVLTMLRLAHTHARYGGAMAVGR